MACEDLRHVCGACGFKWPERSAYDELTFENMRLRDENARMRAALLMLDGWDMLNPPNPEQIADANWLRTTVDRGLGKQPT